jgi:hypothetical protein
MRKKAARRRDLLANRLFLSNVLIKPIDDSAA